MAQWRVEHAVTITVAVRERERDGDGSRPLDVARRFF
jgi:hypothetical protein